MNLLPLQQAERQPDLPMRLDSDFGVLNLQRWLRTLPGKRYVAQAELNGSPVLVKLYLGLRAKSKSAAEVAGLKLLHERNLPAPALLQQGSNGSGAWVVCEWLSQATTLSESAEVSVEGLSSQTEMPQCAGDVARLIAAMHQQGVVQQDVHPANFLFSENTWKIVDAADIQVVASADKNIYSNNLGVFLAQLPEAWQTGILSCYAAEIESTELAVNAVAIEKSRQWRAWRAQDLASKSLRDCSLFQVKHTFNRFESTWRDCNKSLPDLESSLQQAKLLKDGGSSTVGLIEYAGKTVVLKRYNLKSWLHWLKRFWRPTRACHSWVAGHRLRVLGVATPKPLAIIEERIGPLRKRGFLLTEVATGQDLVSVCQASSITKSVAEQVADVLQIFAREKITHGDFKATNLLWAESLSLIDLDSVRWHKSEIKWAAAFEKDIKRLLRNWPENSEQYQVMSEEIRSRLGYCPV